jgi:hypothetical protein
LFLSRGTSRRAEGNLRHRSIHSACRAGISRAGRAALLTALLPGILAGTLAFSADKSAAGAGAPGGPSGANLEYQLKAAFLLNFARFTEWPASADGPPGRPLTICLLGDDPFGPLLDSTVAGKNANGRPLAVRRLGKSDAPAGCEILFVSKPDLLRPAAGQPILTVGESSGFARAGGAVGFFLEDNRIRFEINLDVVQRAGLKVSSRLLDLARVVRSQEAP